MRIHTCTKTTFLFILLACFLCLPGNLIPSLFAAEIDPTLDRQSFLNATQADPGATIADQPKMIIPIQQASGSELDSLSESFDDITTLDGDGWTASNQSQTQGSTDWFQGNPAVFTAQAGCDTCYIAANFNNTDTGYISNWLVTPELNLYDGTISFWTRGADQSIWPDRLQVRLSTNGSSTDTGTTYSDVGDFTILLADINSTESTNTYPETWTQYTYELPSVAPGTTGRIAFRYYVSDGGPEGSNSDYIGIDEVTYSSSTNYSVPTVNEWGMIIMSLLVAASAMLFLRRQEDTRVNP